MPESERRKFGIADAMILVAGIALAIAWTRFVDDPYRMRFQGPESSIRVPQDPDPTDPTTVRGRFERVVRLVQVVQRHDYAALLPIMLALAIAGLRSGRRVDLLTRPGTTAVVAGTVAAIFRAGQNLFTKIFHHEWFGEILSFLPAPSPYAATSFAYEIWRDTYTIGLAIGFIWLYMRLSGRWQARKDWLDRAGRLIGFYWIAMAILPRV